MNKETYLKIFNHFGWENQRRKLQEELDDYIAQQDKLLKNKELLNQKLERVLGPALREGYWTPDTYEDPGESKIVDVIPRTE